MGLLRSLGPLRARVPAYLPMSTRDRPLPSRVYLYTYFSPSAIKNQQPTGWSWFWNLREQNKRKKTKSNRDRFYYPRAREANKQPTRRFFAARAWKRVNFASAAFPTQRVDFSSSSSSSSELQAVGYRYMGTGTGIQNPLRTAAVEIKRESYNRG